MSKPLQTPLFGVDCTSEIGTAALKFANVRFVARYLSRYTPKVLTSAELAHYRAAGIDVITVFEDGAANALQGSAQGRSDAAFALGQATELGIPAGRPIYFAVDFDTAHAPEHTDAYFDGVISVLGKERTGVYGGIEVITHQMSRGVAYGWQTYAWSGGQWDGRAQVRQYSNGHTVGGVGVDYDQAVFEDYGQWGYNAQPDDPHHYLWFYRGPFKHGNRNLNERAIVKEYDSLRKHPFKNRKRLRALRKDCKFLSDRIYVLAHAQARPDGPVGFSGNVKPDWAKYHRGWRFQQLRHRYRGRRVVK